MVQDLFIGTAGWSVERAIPGFQQEGSALARYASRFNAVEVNSSFHRRHRQSTWQRWHDTVPSEFKFSVKLPKTITHERQLTDADADLDLFFYDIRGLNDKLAAVLVQLPPKLAFQKESAGAFFAAFRARSLVPIFIEPRHPSWAAAGASELLQDFAVKWVYADPQQADLQAAAISDGAAYLRLHGSPKIYYSAYVAEKLQNFADLLKAGAGHRWCIFDNTASGAALKDALSLLDLFV